MSAMNLLTVAVIITLLFAVISFGIFVWCILQRVKAGQTTKTVIPPGDLAQLIEAFAKLIDSLNKATCTTFGFVGALAFLLIALYVLTQFPQ
jgi:hypothetical protein